MFICLVCKMCTFCKIWTCEKPLGDLLWLTGLSLINNYICVLSMCQFFSQNFVCKQLFADRTKTWVKISVKSIFWNCWIKNFRCMELYIAGLSKAASTMSNIRVLQVVGELILMTQKCVNIESLTILFWPFWTVQQQLLFRIQSTKYFVHYPI